MIKVNGDILEWTQDMTVSDILNIKNYIFPMIVITINGSHIKPINYNTTLVPDNSSVQVIHLISGG